MRTPPVPKPRRETNVVRMKMYCIPNTPDTKTGDVDGAIVTTGPNCLAGVAPP